MADMFPGAVRQKTGESMPGTTWLSSQPARILREPGGTSRKATATVIFSLERLLSGGTKQTWEHANKLRKPVLHIYNARQERILNQDSLRLEIQALTDFLCSNKIEILNVAGPRESKELGVYEWTLTMLRLSLRSGGY
jgi:Circularly permutated YpsA SLOG family